MKALKLTLMVILICLCGSQAFAIPDLYIDGILTSPAAGPNQDLLFLSGGLSFGMTGGIQRDRPVAVVDEKIDIKRLQVFKQCDRVSKPRMAGFQFGEDSGSIVSHKEAKRLKRA